MDIQDHVTTKEVSLKLWELGVRRESVFWWLIDKNQTHLLESDSWWIDRWVRYGLYDGVYSGTLPAYLASELMEMLRYRFEMDLPEEDVFPREYPTNMAEANDKLGHMNKLLQKYIRPVEIKIEWSVSRGRPYYFVSIFDRLEPHRIYWSSEFAGLSDVLAQCLIYLLESNIVTLDEINDNTDARTQI